MADLNQEMQTNSEVSEELGFFDDYQEGDGVVEDNELEAEEEAEEVEDKPIKTETEDSTEEKKGESKEEEPFLTIKYNKETRNLTREEALELAQKGSNYDKVLEKHNALNNKLESLAQTLGLDVDGLIERLGTIQHEHEVSQELATLKEKYPNADDEVLKELAEKRISDNKAVKEVESKTAHEQELNRQLDRFTQKYPNIDPTKLDEKVYDLMDNEGLSLLEAYQEVEMQKKMVELEQKRKIEEKNEANKLKSIGNLTNTADGDAEDSFLQGFNFSRF